jgi:D-3-phosphoglycerate dehydrogenase / 2-oxoglutarate reductase
LHVVAWSRSLTPERAERLGLKALASPEEVAAAADIVSVHLALNSSTKGRLATPFFQALPESAIFVNTARAELVEQAALTKAIQDRKLRVGLDVFGQEPAGGTGPFSDPVGQLSSVYGTHHIGASTEQAQEAIAAETVRIIQVFRDTGNVPNVVNLARHTPATHALVVRHLDRPGVLAGVLDALRGAQINVQEMENVIFEGAEAAVAHINLDKPPAPELLARCRAENNNILEMNLLALS